MRFIIWRTSDWARENQPIEEATHDGEQWYLDAMSVEQLFELVEKYGPVILKVDFMTGKPGLEIYDDYRE